MRLFRTMRLHALALVLLGGWAAADPLQAHENSCLEIRARAVDLAQSREIEGLRHEFERAQIDVTCSEDFRTWLATTIATLMAHDAFQRVQLGEPMAAQEQMLLEALSYRRQWQSLFWLGDIAIERDDYAAAGTFYQQALASIDDEIETPQAPSPEIIELVFTRAQEALLLADEYIETPKTRSGETTGTGAVSLRGFTPVSVAVPVRFEFDSVVFTGQGQDAASGLLDTLRQQGEPAIMLIGHTDQSGAASYNDALSERRAAALRDWLQTRGYSGQIQILGRGEYEPFPVTDPSRYDADEINAMNRRVEYRRLP